MKPAHFGKRKADLSGGNAELLLCFLSAQQSSGFSLNAGICQGWFFQLHFVQSLQFVPADGFLFAGQE